MTTIADNKGSNGMSKEKKERKSRMKGRYFKGVQK